MFKLQQADIYGLDCYGGGGVVLLLLPTLIPSNNSMISSIIGLAIVNCS